MHPILDPEYRVKVGRIKYIPIEYEIELERLSQMTGKSVITLVVAALSLALPEILLQVAHELGLERDEIEKRLTLPS